MLTRADRGSLTITWNGRDIPARPGDSIATALLAAGITATRTTAISATPRGPYCMMGACFECLAQVDGIPNTQACMTPVRDGMRVETQHGSRALPARPFASTVC
jgi:hypothetical protein